jgi:glycosyltransferase involved in cell wall biosynthesis
MKVLHVCPTYWPAFESGGPTQSVHSLNKALVKNGINVTVYTTDVGLRGDFWRRLKRENNLNGVRVIYFKSFGYKHYNFSPTLFWALAFHAGSFDIIHLTGIWNFTVAFGVFWAKIYRKPYIISPRGSLMKEPLKRKGSVRKNIYLSVFGKMFLRDAALIHFTAENEKEEYLEAGFPLKKGIIISNSFDTEEFENLREGADGKRFRNKFNISERQKVILFLSRLSWKKGFDTLLPAFADVLKKEKDAILVLAGCDDEGYAEKVEEIAFSVGFRKDQIISLIHPQGNKLAVDPKIIFTGMLLDKDKVSAFLGSDVFVLPSYSENFGMAVAEAMCFELPIIVTKYVGIAPLIKERGAGVVIEKNRDELAGAILKVLEGRADVRQMVRAAKKLVEEFSLSRVATAMSEAYKKAINS